MYPKYMFIFDMCDLFDVTLFHRCVVNWSLRGICILSICAFCYICNLFVSWYSIDVLSIGMEDICILNICAI